MTELPQELQRFEAELVRAARRRHRGRAHRARRLRLAVAVVGAFLMVSGLAVAGGVVTLPFGAAPRAVVYSVTAIEPGGDVVRTRCSETAGDAACTTSGRRLPLNRLATELQRRGVAHGTVTLARVCRRGAGCRTLPAGGASVAGRAVPRGELLSTMVIGLRPPPRGEPITAFTTAASVVEGDGGTLAVTGGPYTGRTVTCASAADDPLCALQRAATTTTGLLDVERFLRSAGATAMVTEVGRRCALTGDGACRGIAPDQARRLAADPAALRRGEVVRYERQVTARGFSAPLPRVAKPPRRR